jgi:uncharacterized membrane protein
MGKATPSCLGPAVRDHQVFAISALLVDNAAGLWRAGPSVAGEARTAMATSRRLPETGQMAKARAALLALIIALFLSTAARAEFTVCNQTLDVVNLAVGQEIDSTFQTDGWWTVGANQCVNVIREELSSRYIYVYATDVFGHPILSGATDMCIQKRRFTIRGTEECWQRGHIAAAFYEVDTLAQVRWTLFLTGQGP